MLSIVKPDRVFNCFEFKRLLECNIICEHLSLSNLCQMFTIFFFIFTIYSNSSYQEETVYRCSGVQAPGDQVSQFGCKSYQCPGVCASEQF